MIRINLLPVRAEKKRESLRQQVVLGVAVLVLLGIGIGAVHVMLTNDIADLQTRIAQRRAEISRLQGIIGEVREFRKKKRELEEKIEVIAQLEARQRGPVRVLDELARIVPKEIWIEKLKDSGGALSLEGFAIDNQTIARFMTSMEASPWFRGVRLEVTRQVAKGGVNLKAFTIRASVAYREAG
ncbi:MAG: PilN domain-containing protein [Thermodesulfobacteriota bacterium]|jgi:type IV pilus assembly protein PilN